MDNSGDLSSLLGSILSDPAAMDQVFKAAESFGFDISGGQDSTSPPQDDCGRDDGPDILGTVLRLAPLLASLSKEDDTTRLLTALRPFLHDEKAKRVDEAKKLLTLLRVLSVLRDAGITGGVL